MTDEAQVTMTNPVLDPARYPVLPEALLQNARLMPSRLAALALWPQDAVIAEIGVALGEFSGAILKACRPRRFLAIDRFDLHELPTLWNRPTAEIFGGKTHGEFYRARFADEIARGQMSVLEGDSAAMIAGLPDASVDVFYVDADHRYEGVVRDLEAILPKIAPDGWIVMNDYIPAETGLSNEPYGVIQATHEFMVKYGWEMGYFALAYVMYCDVGLRRAGRPITLPPYLDAMTARLATELEDSGITHRRRSEDRAKIQALEAHIAELEAALTTMRRSTSWRATAPLRALSHLLSRR
jgi:hypothetical protein